jgi:glycosyl transferase family 87
VRIRRTFMLGIIVLMLGDFVFRGIVPSFTAGKNDFTDPYVGAYLWRQGTNPYDMADATATGRLLTGSQMRVIPIYPPTAYLLVLPLTVLPWGWANLLLALTETLGVCAVAWCVVGISGRTRHDEEAWVIAALVMAFASFHTAVHVANLSVVSTALCVVSVYLATDDRDHAAGVFLGIAACLKPHLAIWLFGFYAVRRKWRLLAAGGLTGVMLLATSITRVWLRPTALLASYFANLKHWFGPGGQNDFSLANPLRFELANFQLVLDPLLGRSGATVVAFGIAALGLGVWIYAILRNPMSSPALAITTLIALSFLPVYHRVYDTGILTLSLAWLFESDHRQHTVKRIALALFLILLLPVQSGAVRFQSYLSPQAIHSWWWNSMIVPYTAWMLLAFSAVLLYALVQPVWTSHRFG